MRELIRAVLVVAIATISAASEVSANPAAPSVEIGAGAVLVGPITVRDEKGNIVLHLLPKATVTVAKRP